VAKVLGEYYLPHKSFRQVAHMSAYEIEVMGDKYPEARGTESGIPVFGMMFALNSERKKLTEAFGSNLNKDVGEAKLEWELKEENILSKKILNQTKLGILILKSEASERVRKVFRAVMNTIKVGIKHASTRIMSMEIRTVRDIEMVLTDVWNEAIEELEKGAKVISWEEDGSSNLLRTRLSDLEAQDPEFVDAVKQRQREHGEN